MNIYEDIYKVEILTANKGIITEDIKAINDLEAIDIAYAKHKNENIIDIKVV